MDLKDVIATVNEKAMEAHSAFHAGHHDVAEQHLRRLTVEVDQYFRESSTSAGDVTESTTSEKPDATEQEKPAEVPGAALPATQFDSRAAAQQIGTGSAEPKPNQ